VKAVYYETFGSADVLVMGEQAVPEPGPGQVLVEVSAASVNPIDRRLRAGELQDFFAREFPVIPGWDVAGRIADLGAGVTGLAVGDEVVGLAFTWKLHAGTYAEYVAIDAASVAPKPRNLSFTQAAALPLVSLTAWQSLQETARVTQGDTVFIQAGAGGLGSVAISMARYLGARVYTTTRSENFDYVRSLGADFPIDYARSSYVEVLRAEEPAGIDMVLESLEGDEVVASAIRIAKDGGTVVYMNNEPPETPEIKARHIKTLWLHHRADGKMLAELMTLFGQGRLDLPRIEVMPLAEAAQAHRRSESGRTHGKIVLRIRD